MDVLVIGKDETVARFASSQGSGVSSVETTDSGSPTMTNAEEYYLDA